MPDVFNGDHDVGGNGAETFTVREDLFTGTFVDANGGTDTLDADGAWTINDAVTLLDFEVDVIQRVDGELGDIAQRDPAHFVFPRAANRCLGVGYIEADDGAEPDFHKVGGLQDGVIQAALLQMLLDRAFGFGQRAIHLDACRDINELLYACGARGIDARPCRIGIKRGELGTHRIDEGGRNSITGKGVARIAAVRVQSCRRAGLYIDQPRRGHQSRAHGERCPARSVGTSFG